MTNTTWRENVRLLERAARLRRIRELNAPQVIIDHMERMVEDSKALAEAEAALNEAIMSDYNDEDPPSTDS